MTLVGVSGLNLADRPGPGCPSMSEGGRSMAPIVAPIAMLEGVVFSRVYAIHAIMLTASHPCLAVRACSGRCPAFRGRALSVQTPSHQFGIDAERVRPMGA